ncbi:hypothetical protein N657DRAFT_642586 [Parathielavia appendiculata]|uniref:Uncharacterized protein n=1 Tax=Parathielavia appendiculata TaxID=2587402 RepID=A0AAN6U3K6_9PEZI|nr:hypothetical protein N657DRAFT_642586 [Parathielavia appendiculata]
MIDKFKHPSTNSFAERWLLTISASGDFRQFFEGPSCRHILQFAATIRRVNPHAQHASEVPHWWRGDNYPVFQQAGSLTVRPNDELFRQTGHLVPLVLSSCKEEDAVCELDGVVLGSQPVRVGFWFWKPKASHGGWNWAVEIWRVAQENTLAAGHGKYVCVR